MPWFKHRVFLYQDCTGEGVLQTSNFPATFFIYIMNEWGSEVFEDPLCRKCTKTMSNLDLGTSFLNTVAPDRHPFKFMFQMFWLQNLLEICDHLQRWTLQVIDRNEAGFGFHVKIRWKTSGTISCLGCRCLHFSNVFSFIINEWEREVCNDRCCRKSTKTIPNLDLGPFFFLHIFT